MHEIVEYKQSVLEKKLFDLENQFYRSLAKTSIKVRVLSKAQHIYYWHLRDSNLIFRNEYISRSQAFTTQLILTLLTNFNSINTSNLIIS